MSVVAVVAVAATIEPLRDHLLRLMDVCLSAMPPHAESTSGAARWGGLLAAPVVARLLWVALGDVRRTRRARASRSVLLDVIAPQDDRRGFAVVEHGDRAAFCYGGRRPRIVVTTGALGVLTACELDAVVAHERAHLGGRHHSLLRMVDVLARVAPFVPLFRAARQDLPPLLEQCADLSAARLTSPDAVAAALLKLSIRPAPQGALAVSSGMVDRRLHSLRRAARPAPWEMLLVSGALVPAAALVATAVASALACRA